MKYLTIILLFVCLSAYGQMSEPYLHYSFDDVLDDSGSANLDLVAYGNAQFSSTSKAVGSHSGLLDGTGDYFRVPVADFGTEFFVSFWLRSDLDITGYKYAFCIANSDNFLWRVQPTNVIRGYGGLGYSLTSKTWVKTTWTHIVLYYNSTTGRNQMWFDGGAKAATDSTVSTGFNTNDSLFIGCYYDRGGAWDGNIDEFRVYKGFRPTDAQIDSLYNLTYVSALPAYSADLIPWVNGVEKRPYVDGVLKKMGYTPATMGIISGIGINEEMGPEDYDGVCPSGATRWTDTDCGGIDFNSFLLRKIKSVADYAGIYYIDPTTTATTRTGTFSNPYKYWSDVTQAANTAYLWKRGTTMESSAQINITAENILLGAYGTGAAPIIESTGLVNIFWITGDYCTVRDLSLKIPMSHPAENPAHVRYSYSGIQMAGDIHTDIYNNEMSYMSFGIRTAYVQRSVRIIGNHIHNVTTEGMYIMANEYQEIAWNNIHDVNELAAIDDDIDWDLNGDGTIQTSERNTGSTGDVIETQFWNDIWIHHNILDHGSQPNKGTIMFHDDGSSERAIVEFNVLVSPIQGTSSTQTTNGSGNKVYRNNLIFASPDEPTLKTCTGIYTETGVDSIIGNVFVGFGTAIYSPCTGSVIINNTFYGNNNIQWWSAGRVIAQWRNNITYNNTNIWSAGMSATSSSNNLATNPNYVNPTLDPYINNFRVTAGSGAIGTGYTFPKHFYDIEGTTVPQSTQDIGAYEYTP